MNAFTPVPQCCRSDSLGIPDLFHMRRTMSGMEEMDRLPLPVFETEAEEEVFSRRLEEKNDREFAHVQDLLSRAMASQGIHPAEQSIAIATSGSDGRREKTGRFSPFELMVIGTEPSDRFRNAVDRITNLVKTDPVLRESISPTIEVKELSGGLVNTRVFPKETKVIPSKPLDAQFLVGCQTTFEQYKAKFHSEWKEKRVAMRDFQSGFVRKELKNLKDQLESEGPGINSETGELIFITHPASPQEMSQRGPKHGATRFLQYSLTKFIVQHIETLSDGDAYDFIRQLPKSTVHRVLWLSQQRILPFTPKELKDFKKVYNNLLLWYAVLQDRASRSDERVVTAQVPVETLKETLSAAQALGTKLLEGPRQLPRAEG